MILFVDIDRERPKYQIKDDEESPTNGPRTIGESSDTVKVSRNLREETVRARWVKPKIKVSCSKKH